MFALGGQKVFLINYGEYSVYKSFFENLMCYDRKKVNSLIDLAIHPLVGSRGGEPIKNKTISLLKSGDCQLCSDMSVDKILKLISKKYFILFMVDGVF